MSLWDDGRRWLGGKGELPDPNAPVDPRELEGRINDLRALLASSTRQLEILAANEARLQAEEAELVTKTKTALKAGDRAKAGEHALDLEKIRHEIAGVRARREATRASHDKAESIAQAYEKAAELARPKKPRSSGRVDPKPLELDSDKPPPEDPVELLPADSKKPAPEDSVELLPNHPKRANTEDPGEAPAPPEPAKPHPITVRARALVEEVAKRRAAFDAGELAEHAYSAASRTVSWLRELVEPAAARNDGPGQLAFERGDHERAVADCTRALERNPRDAVALCNRGASLAMLNRPEDAILDYDRSIALDATNALSWSNRSDAKLTLDDLDGAIADATSALKLDPNLALARFNRGRAHASQGLWAAARDDFAESVRLTPDHALSHAHLSVAVLALGDSSAAIASASRALRLEPELAFARRARAQARLAAGTGKGSVAGSPKSLRELEGALEDVDAAIRKSGEQAGDRGLRAQIRHAQGDKAGALTEIAAGAGGEEPAKVLARARWRLETNDLHGALQELSDGLERGLPRVPLLVLRGEALSRAGDHAAALTDLSRALELEPRSGPAREARGRAHFGAGEPLLALQDAEIALEVGHEAALDVRGFALWELGDLAGAARDLARAVALNPAHDAAHEALGRCRVALGERAPARRSFERAVALEPARYHALLWVTALGGDRALSDALAVSTKWIGHLARLVRGNARAEDVLELASLAGDDGQAREQLCDAHVFAGYQKERAGDHAAALRHYEAAFATGAEGASEHAWVRARLARERARSPLADDVRLEKLAELGVLTASELAEARRLLAVGCPPPPEK